MSTTQPRGNKIVPEGTQGTKLAIFQLNPSYTVRVAFCLVFFFIMEIFLAHYVYRFIISEVRENLKQNDFQTQIRIEAFREEVLKIFTDMGFKNGRKLQLTPPQATAARKKRSVGLADSNHNEMELLSSCPKIKDFCLQIPGHDSPPGLIEYNNTLINTTNTTGMAETAGIAGESNDELPIPPKLIGYETDFLESISVNEGQPVRLNCSATGNPVSVVTWQKLDENGNRINAGRGTWGHDYSRAGASALDAIKIHRYDMGKYRCTADNGIHPRANHTFDLKVNFSPKINIANSTVEVANGSTAMLECDVEAFPKPIHFWELSDGTLLENNTKFQIFNSEVRDLYKYKTQLKITNVTFDDMKYQYRCNSKNEINITTGDIKLHVLDPISFNQSRDRTSPSPVTEVLPATEDVNVDLVIKWEIRPYGNFSSQRHNLTQTADCLLYDIGTPELHKSLEFDYGCWMKDAHPDATIPGYFWATTENRSRELFEYWDYFDYKKDHASRVYVLKEPFSGNSQTVYNGSFFYHINGTNRIMKYGLNDNSTKYLDLPGDMNRRSKLYSRQHNYVDFCVDENGLWLIFAVEDSNNTAVMKVDYENMTPQYTWNISLEHQNVGEMFIACGVLYAVDSVTDRDTKISIAVDLYRNVQSDVNLNFTNPFIQRLLC